MVRELFERGAGEVAETFVVEIVERRSDDPALGQQAGLGQVEHPGQELAAREITGRAEEHHDVRPQRLDQIRVDVGGFMHLSHPL